MLLDINITNFIGRLHPLVVHLPIGFLLLGAVFFFLSNKTRFDFLKKALPLTLFLGMISAIIAALFGWLLSDEGGYDENALFWHKWLGIGVAVLATITWFWSKGNLGNHKRAFGNILFLATTALLFFAGHQGGNLTHGADYLLKPLKGNQQNNTLEIPAQPDSIIVYQHLIQPVLEQKCYSCHNDQTQNGKLNLSSWEGLKKGGAGGPVIDSDVWSSELFKRVTLPQVSKKFMPTKGEPMSFAEVHVLKWWLSQGAKPKAALTSLELPDQTKELLLEVYGIDTKPKAFVETIEVPALSDTLLEVLKTNKWKADYLGENNFLLDVSPLEKGPISMEQFKSLNNVSEHITWLDLSNCELNDEQLKSFGTFTNLSRLRLQNNNITDAALDYLLDLKNLESLNLYNNPITDEGLKSLEKIASLKRVYLWQTKVSEEGKSNFKKARPDIEL